MDYVEIDKDLFADAFPQKNAVSHKGTYGQACVIGGSSSYVGAPQFSAESAARLLAALGKASMLSGAGTSMLAVPDFLQSALYPVTRYSGIIPLKSDGKRIVYDEAQIDALLARSSAFAIGMGMGGGDAETIVKHILIHGEQNFVVDADALFSTKEITDFEGRAVLTPHVGEMARLLSLPVEAVENNAAEIARGYAELVNAVVCIKGAPQTFISDGERVYLNTSGTPRLAKGGSGDVLSGVICGLLAWGKSPVEAAVLGVWLCGRAAELSDVNEYSHLPDDIVAALPKAVDELIGH